LASLKIQGSERLKANLERLLRDAPDEMGKALHEVGRDISRESQKRTPVLTGALRASHVVHKAVVTWDDITVLIEVGGPSADYAVHVHYRDELNHSVGQSRFLESALNDARPGLAFQLAKAFSRVTKNKVR